MEAKSNETQSLSNAERQARFKANKAFKSLPADVQHSIERLSDTPEEKATRTANAIRYQRLRLKGIMVSQGQSANVIHSVIPDGTTVIGPVRALHKAIEKQSHNPMMVGYVPPRAG